MEILTKLGIDYTFYYQLAIFVVAYIALSRLVFKPYLKAYHKRLEVTFGNQEQAEKLNESVRELHIQYETRSREVNSRVQSFFDIAQKEGQLIQAQTLDTARKQAESHVESSRKDIDAAVVRARSDIKKHIPELSQEISKKILSKVMS